MGSRAQLGRRALLLTFCFFALSSVGVAAACRDDTVRLRGDWGAARFTVEIADEPAEQQRGLMFREAMPASAGMLFVYETPRSMTFWMRNTLIELDILFIDADGIVRRIHHRAQPLDETIIDGGRGVAALEINGGLARRMGIDVGTEVQHPRLDGAVWAC